MEMKKNSYMEQVQQQALDVERELRSRRAPSEEPTAGAAMAPGAPMMMARGGGGGGLPPDAPRGPRALGVRITGFWPFQTVVVPPNVYVIHTRRGHDKPLHTGLGISFRFNPFADSFLAVPSAVQTILINANTICKELQGILIQAYVQWIVHDIEVAYRRLDFSDVDDPMRVVNVQLREQTEAAIKDKVATMSIREVLSDKQPIISELTRRLKEVAEGSGDDRGLGIRIVTVQIKEAVVSSTTLWENLQKPFRAEQKTTARLAEIENDAAVGRREVEWKKDQETRKLETESELARLRDGKEAEKFDRERTETLRRHALDQEGARRTTEETLATERFEAEKRGELEDHERALRVRFEAVERERQFEAEKQRIELDVARLGIVAGELAARLEFEIKEKRKDWELRGLEQQERLKSESAELAARLERDGRSAEARNAQARIDLDFEETRQRIANEVSDPRIRLEALRGLPALAAALPKPDRLETVSIGEGHGSTLASTAASLMALLRSYGVLPPTVPSPGPGAPETRPSD